MPKLTILSIAYPFAPVSEDSVGGAEQILAAVDAAIVAAGHRSVVIAAEGSRTSGELVPIRLERGTLDGAAIGRAHAEIMQRAARVLERESVDVVHMHGIDFDRYLPPPGPPALATLHLPPSWYAREALRPARPNTHLCCVSDAQHAALPVWAAPAEVIPNGVRVDGFRVRARNAGFCLLLARICPEKGVHEALDAATAVGAPLVIAGDIGPWEAHRHYFEDVVQRRLAPPHRWIGPVGFARKRRLLAAARALLVPSRAPETSSLVSMEALASGTPVIAYATGALPRIVEHGVTGFVVRDASEMAQAIRDVDRISPEACRRAATERFSSRTMTDRYLATYERLARRASPTTSSSGTGEALAIARVRGTDELRAISAEWSALWRQCPTATPFQSPEWLLAYVHAFCAPDFAEPWAITVRKQGALVGLGPLCTRRRDGDTTTTLLGDGVSDYLDVVVAPAEARAATSAIYEELRNTGASSGHVILDELRECSPLVACAPRSELERFDRGPCPVLRLTDGVDPLPPVMREKIRYYERRAERAGGMAIEEPTGSSLERWLETLFVLHAARWASRGEKGVLASPEVQRFQREAVTTLAASGIARIYGLRVGDRPAAAMLVLRDAWAAYYYIGGFDPELAAFSPGTVLIAHAIDRSHADGLCEFDFLRGREEYKYRFGARDRFNRGLRLKSSRAAA